MGRIAGMYCTSIKSSLLFTLFRKNIGSAASYEAKYIDFGWCGKNSSNAEALLLIVESDAAHW